MLEHLHISNVVLIEKLSLDFAKGLCALTGETGAGKSILLDSLGLAMGARSEARLVRKGEDMASVTASFSLEKPDSFKALAEENGLEINGELILRRQVNADGRSRAWVNDQPVSITLLKEIGDMLVEYHGQFETHGLLNPKTHQSFLDEYAGLEIELKRLEEYWTSWREAKRELANARAQAEKAKAEEEYIRTSVEDLSALDPQENEEDGLLDQRTRLKNKDQIIQTLRGALEGLISEEGAESRLVQTARLLEKSGDKLGEKGADIISLLDRSIENTREAAGAIENMAHEFDEGGISLEQLEDRLYALRDQARKHGCNVNELPKKLEELAKSLELIDGQETALDELEKKVASARSAYERLADEVSERRKEKANILDELVMKELMPLKLERAVFTTQVITEDEDAWGAKGKDTVCFLVATNPGAEPGPINKIASGGEMARFMLALKVVLAEVGSAQTLVFDEVDTGIGGATADAVGQRLAKLAQYKQILVVTHSPQVAASASTHWIVAKGGDENVTTTVIALDNPEKRREEIARMLAGAQITEEARAAAGKLLETDRAA